MIERFYRMTGEVQRKTLVSDGMGGGSTSWATILTSRGVLDLSSGNEVYRGNKITLESTHTWFCGAMHLTVGEEEQTTYFGSPFPSATGGLPTEIRNTDRLLVDGVKYEILYVDNPMNMGHHLEIALRRLESGQV